MKKLKIVIVSVILLLVISFTALELGLLDKEIKYSQRDSTTHQVITEITYTLQYDNQLEVIYIVTSYDGEILVNNKSTHDLIGQSNSETHKVYLYKEYRVVYDRETKEYTIYRSSGEVIR